MLRADADWLGADPHGVRGGSRGYTATRRRRHEPFFYDSSSPWNLHPSCPSSSSTRLPSRPGAAPRPARHDCRPASRRDTLIPGRLELHPSCPSAPTATPARRNSRCTPRAVRAYPGRNPRRLHLEVRLDPGDGRVERDDRRRGSPTTSRSRSRPTPTPTMSCGRDRLALGAAGVPDMRATNFETGRRRGGDAVDEGPSGRQMPRSVPPSPFQSPTTGRSPGKPKTTGASQATPLAPMRSVNVALGVVDAEVGDAVAVPVAR